MNNNNSDFSCYAINGGIEVAMNGNLPDAQKLEGVPVG
jgi:hypothetical protein